MMIQVTQELEFPPNGFNDLVESPSSWPTSWNNLILLRLKDRGITTLVICNRNRVSDRVVLTDFSSFKRTLQFAVFSPDGVLMVFVSSRINDKWDLYLENYNVSCEPILEVTLLTRHKIISSPSQRRTSIMSGLIAGDTIFMASSHNVIDVYNLLYNENVGCQRIPSVEFKGQMSLLGPDGKNALVPLSLLRKNSTLLFCQYIYDGPYKRGVVAYDILSASADPGSVLPTGFFHLPSSVPKTYGFGHNFTCTDQYLFVYRDFEQRSGKPGAWGEGAVYVFDCSRESSSFGRHVTDVVSPRPANGGYFGSTVDIIGDSLIVGQWGFGNDTIVRRVASFYEFNFEFSNMYEINCAEPYMFITDSNFGLQPDGSIWLAAFSARRERQVLLSLRAISGVTD